MQQVQTRQGQKALQKRAPRKKKGTCCRGGRALGNKTEKEIKSQGKIKQRRHMRQGPHLDGWKRNPQTNYRKPTPSTDVKNNGHKGERENPGGQKKYMRDLGARKAGEDRHLKERGGVKSTCGRRNGGLWSGDGRQRGKKSGLNRVLEAPNKKKTGDVLFEKNDWENRGQAKQNVFEGRPVFKSG